MKPKTILLVVITLAAVGVGGWNLKNLLSRTDAGYESAQRWVVCAETGKAFQKEVQIGETFPVMSPYSKKATGWPAERCYWNADGSVRKEPSYVLLQDYLDKPGPTFCPDCGRLVVARNPGPKEGSKAPPTKEEYAQRKAR